MERIVVELLRHRLVKRTEAGVNIRIVREKLVDIAIEVDDKADLAIADVVNHANRETVPLVDIEAIGSVREVVGLAKNFADRLTSADDETLDLLFFRYRIVRSLVDILDCNLVAVREIGFKRRICRRELHERVEVDAVANPHSLKRRTLLIRLGRAEKRRGRVEVEVFVVRTGVRKDIRNRRQRLARIVRDDEGIRVGTGRIPVACLHTYAIVSLCGVEVISCHIGFGLKACAMIDFIAVHKTMREKRHGCRRQCCH